MELFSPWMNALSMKNKMSKYSCTIFFCFIILSCSNATSLEDVFSEYTTKDPFENWTGRWMPEKPNKPTPPPQAFPSSEDDNKSYGDMSTSMQRIPMGINDGCDDGKTNLTIDWDDSPVNYTCFNKKITPDYNIKALQYCEYIPAAYQAIHECVDKPIEYDDPVPLYGTHRPVWPVYGEYKFVPKQRWLHNMEHGAVVMLYHPCANAVEVNRLKNLVTSCLRRHIITPYNLLDEKRPLALVTWGCRLTMSYVKPSIVKKFIKQKALKGPEQVSGDGQYTHQLIKKAQIVSNIDDDTLCPDM